MNLRQIELFVAIAETGSFSRGAEAVSLTQSTVSQHIAALEAEVAAVLFDRMGRGVLLTAAGDLFLRHARLILAERDALLMSMAGLRGLEGVQLTIGASNIPANYLIPPILRRLQEQHPGISLTMITGDTSNILDRLERAEVELAVVGSRIPCRSTAFLPLLRDSLVLVVGGGHRWQKRKSVALAELMSEPLVVREHGSGSGLSLDKALRQAGQDPAKMTVSARLGSNEAVLQAVSRGFGCAFVSELSVHQRPENKDLSVVEVQGLSVDRQIWLAKLQARTLSPAAEAFSALLGNYYSK